MALDSNSCRIRRFLTAAACSVLLLPAAASAQSWSQTGDVSFSPLRVMSPLASDISLLYADAATVADGAYETSADASGVLLSVSSGRWDTTAASLILGGTNKTAASSLGPYTVRIAGEGTTLKTGVLDANYGVGRLEILDGASVDLCGNVNFAQSGAVGSLYVTQTVVVAESSFTLDGAQCAFGYKNKSYPGSCGYACLYATNSSFTALKPGDVYPYYYFKNGRYVFKDCTFDGWKADSAFNVQIGAEVVIDGSTFTTARYRVGDTGFDHADGSPAIRMLSGSLTTDKFILGTGSSSVTSILHQASGGIDAQYLQLCTGAQPARLELFGGMFLTSYINTGDNSRMKNPSSTGWAHLVADGGTLKCKQVNANHPFISGLDSAEIAAGGLVIDDNGLSCRIVQDFSDAPGENGKLVKTGAGTVSLVIPSEYSVADTEITAGTVHLLTNGVSTSVDMDTSLAIGNGSVLSIEGDVTTLSLASLSLDNSEIVLDPGDVIEVKGAAAVNELVLKFSSVPSVDEAKKFLVVKGEMSDSSVDAVKKAVVANLLEDGEYSEVSAVRTENGIEFTFTVKEAVELTGETAWRGPGSAWADEANWTQGVPGESDVAIFDDPSAPSPVNLASAATVGALGFAGGSYEIAGSGSLTMSSPGASSVTSSAGTNVVSVPVAFPTDVQLSVAPLSSLEFAGSLSGRSLNKTGSGRLVLSGANSLSGMASLGSGLTVVSRSSALSGIISVSVGNGTLAFADGVSGAFPAHAGLVLAATNAGDAVVVDCADDVTVTAFDPASGVLIKRGAGRLTLDASGGRISSLSKNPGDSLNGGGFKTSSCQTFGDAGVPPAGGFGGLTVSEGELVVKGSGSESLECTGKIAVGMFADTCRAQPVLTLDNVGVQVPTDIYQVLEVGFKCGGSNPVTNPVLRVVNGSRLDTVGIQMDFQYSAASRWPVIAVTNSTVSASRNSISLSTVRQSTGYGSFLAAGSTFICDKLSIQGRTRSRLTGCTIRGYSGEYMSLTADRNVAGEVVFDGGTVLKCDSFAMTDYNEKYGSALVLAFDGALWDVGPAGLAIDDSNMLATRPKTFEVRQGGLDLVVASGTTLSTEVPFVGCGALSLDGGGVLAFGEGAFSMTGKVCAVNGTVDFSSAGSVSNFTVSGSGTFTGASFAGRLGIAPAIADDWTADAVPTFDACSFGARVFVDCGRSQADPLPLPSGAVVIARYTGSAPDVSSWRVKGTGRRNAKGVFTAADGAVSMSVAESGMMLIIR